MGKKDTENHKKKIKTEKTPSDPKPGLIQVTIQEQQPALSLPDHLQQSQFQPRLTGGCTKCVTAPVRRDEQRALRLWEQPKDQAKQLQSTWLIKELAETFSLYPSLHKPCRSPAKTNIPTAGHGLPPTPPGHPPVRTGDGFQGPGLEQPSTEDFSISEQRLQPHAALHTGAGPTLVSDAIKGRGPEIRGRRGLGFLYASPNRKY